MEYLQQFSFTKNYWVLLLPCLLMVIDVITGYTNARLKDEQKSTKMREGLGHKMAELAYVVVAILISVAFNQRAIEYFVSIYIIYMELLSIKENCKKLGVKAPKEIDEKLGGSNETNRE